MGFFSKDIKTLDDLCRRVLGELYYAEKRMTKVLPEMIAKASDPLLKRTLDTHLAASQQQLLKIEEIFKSDGASACAVECPAIDGILIEAEELRGEIADAKVLDTALAAAAQTALGFTAGRYATVASWLFETTRADCARKLQRCADEQRRAGADLARLEAHLNARAGGRAAMDLAS
jgi:ferritin-like metal-binding protein YciE